MSIWAMLLYSFSTINYALSFCYQGIWKTKARKKTATEYTIGKLLALLRKKTTTKPASFIQFILLEGLEIICHMGAIFLQWKNNNQRKTQIKWLLLCVCHENLYAFYHKQINHSIEIEKNQRTAQTSQSRIRIQCDYYQKMKSKQIWINFSRIRMVIKFIIAEKRFKYTSCKSITKQRSLVDHAARTVKQNARNSNNPNYLIINWPCIGTNECERD